MENYGCESEYRKRESISKRPGEEKERGGGGGGGGGGGRAVAEWQRKCRGGGAGEVKRVEPHPPSWSWGARGGWSCCAKAEASEPRSHDKKPFLTLSKAG